MIFHQRSLKHRLVEYASGALKYFSGADIRKFALEILPVTKHPADYVDLLISNFKQKDWHLLTSIASKCKNEHETHALVWSYANIFLANKTKACRAPLEAIYDNLTCGIHRMQIVEILKDNNVLSNQIKKEIRYDSYEGTRKLA